MENREPIFAARAVRLMAPPQAVKDKHVGCEWRPATNGALAHGGDGETSLPAVIPTRRRFRSVPAGRQRSRLRHHTIPSSSWRDNIAFKAMGWGLKESCDRLQLLAGDRLDIAYSLGMNDHPEFGGLELTCAT
jgi:hypothetical protein